jgi:hypothetical protein
MKILALGPRLRPGNLPWLSWLYLAVLWLVATSFARGSQPAPPAYETGAADVAKIHADLLRALDPKKRTGLSAQPVLLAEARAPLFALGADGAVRYSPAFLDLMNRLAHARAIDAVEPGFLPRYLDALAAAPAHAPLPELPPSARAWEFDVANHQRSFFNQMTGATLAVCLAHHYLGHARKYESRLAPAEGGVPAPIKPLLSPSEWNDAVLKGAKNALDCGLAVEGLQTILTGLSAMKTPPSWTACFVPPRADAPKLNKQLARLEKDFFLADK